MAEATPRITLPPPAALTDKLPPSGECQTKPTTLGGKRREKKIWLLFSEKKRKRARSDDRTRTLLTRHPFSGTGTVTKPQPWSDVVLCPPNFPIPSGDGVAGVRTTLPSIPPILPTAPFPPVFALTQSPLNTPAFRLPFDLASPPFPIEVCGSCTHPPTPPRPRFPPFSLALEKIFPIYSPLSGKHTPHAHSPRNRPESNHHWPSMANNNNNSSSNSANRSSTLLLGALKRAA
jgi:hypothetical protein